VEIRIVDELPRTASAKVDLAAVTALFDGAS
jgi:acyl-coenzyme A synthetase/AMP-(fatty) acid ligase